VTVLPIEDWFLRSASAMLGLFRTRIQPANHAAINAAPVSLLPVIVSTVTEIIEAQRPPAHALVDIMTVEFLIARNVLTRARLA